MVQELDEGMIGFQRSSCIADLLNGGITPQACSIVQVKIFPHFGL
jgi:hypothetical protein